MASKKAKEIAAAAAEAEQRKAATTAAGRELERRAFIETLAGMRVPPETIGMLLVPPVSAETLKADYARELEAGPAKVDAKIANGILAFLEKGDRTTLIFLSKVFLGWRETGSEQRKEQPLEPENLAPTKLPSAAQISREILPFPGRSSRQS